MALAGKLSRCRDDVRFLFQLLFSQNVPQSGFEFRIAEYEARSRLTTVDARYPGRSHVEARQRIPICA